MGLPGIVLLIFLWQTPQSSSVNASSETLVQINHEADQAISSNQFDTAIELIKKGLRIDPNWNDGLWKAGLILYQHNRFEQARGYFHRLTLADQTRGAAWALEGMCKFQLHEFRSAIDDIGRADRLGIPSELNLAETARFDRAIAYIELRDFGSSIDFLNQMVRGGSVDEREQLIALFGYASLQQSLYRPLTTGQTAVLGPLGEARYSSANNDSSRSTAILEGLIQKYPAEPMLHYTYGSLLVGWSQYDAAKAQFHMELAINPTSVAARLALAYIGIETQDAAVAIPYALEASKMSPSAYQAHFYLGRLLIASGQLVNGCHELEIAHTLSPSSTDVLYALATAHRQLGRRKEAAGEFKDFQRLEQLDRAATDGGPSRPSSPNPSVHHE